MSVLDFRFLPAAPVNLNHWSSLRKSQARSPSQEFGPPPFRCSPTWSVLQASVRLVAVRHSEGCGRAVVLGSVVMSMLVVLLEDSVTTFFLFCRHLIRALIKALIIGTQRVAWPKPQFSGATRIFFYKSKPISVLKFIPSKLIFSMLLYEVFKADLKSSPYEVTTITLLNLKIWIFNGYIAVGIY